MLASKRAFDIIVTLFASVLWVPVLVICWSVIVILDGRPGFYVSQRRIRHDKLARVLKFRTMIRNIDIKYNRDTVSIENDVCFLNTAIDSPLYTPVGRFIESYALTEVPQLLSVLGGKMSLVGNRPLPENVVQALERAHPNARGRFFTPAGLAGPVQLIGRTNLSDEERLGLEIAYCRIAATTNTWVLDFIILLFTVLVALGFKEPLTVDAVHELMNRYAGIPTPWREAWARIGSSSVR